jgi:Ring finger domain
MMEGLSDWVELITNDDAIFVMSKPIPILLPRMALKTEGLCSICMEPHVKGEFIVESQCKHIFHDHCMSEWLKIKQTCPMCRAYVKGDMSL